MAVKEAKKEIIIHQARGGIFPGELGGYNGYCSVNSSGDGAYYWSAHNSDERMQRLRFFVELGLENPRKLSNYGDVASSSTSRALAELSTFAEGVVPNLPQLLEATAQQVLSSEKISLYDAEHVIATYKYLLGHKAAGVTQEQYQAFADAIVQECQKQAEELENIIIPGAEINFRLQDFCRQSKYIQKLVGQIQISENENLDDWASRLSTQNILNDIQNIRDEFSDTAGGFTPRNAQECYYKVVRVFNDCVSGLDVYSGDVEFSPYSSPFLPADEEVVREAFSEFRQEMYRAAHPIRTNVSEVVNMLRGDWAETKAVFGKVGRKVGLLPTPENK